MLLRTATYCYYDYILLLHTLVHIVVRAHIVTSSIDLAHACNRSEYSTSGVVLVIIEVV
jgi:hypothetical protein